MLAKEAGELTVETANEAAGKVQEMYKETSAEGQKVLFQAHLMLEKIGQSFPDSMKFLFQAGEKPMETMDDYLKTRSGLVKAVEPSVGLNEKIGKLVAEFPQAISEGAKVALEKLNKATEAFEARLHGSSFKAMKELPKPKAILKITSIQDSQGRVVPLIEKSSTEESVTLSETEKDAQHIRDMTAWAEKNTQDKGSSK